MGARPAAICLVVVVSAAAADSLNVRRVGGIDTPGEAYGVAVQGDYAYVADGDSGLRVISVADPTQPADIGRLNTPGRLYGVIVLGSKLYAAADTAGLRVISVADPAQPAEVGYLSPPGRVYGIAIGGASFEYVYAAADTAGLRVISVADPAHPIEVGHNDTLKRAYGVAEWGDYVCVANGDVFSVVSISDPTHPTRAGGYGVMGTEAHGVIVDGTRAYVAASVAGLHIFSLADPRKPTLMGQCGPFTWAWALALSGSHAYLAADEAGLRVISVADPEIPDEVGYYDMPGWVNGVAVSGEYVYVAYGREGLQVFQYCGPGIEEGRPQAAGIKPQATVARGVLVLGAVDSRQQSAFRADLLDIAGREVMDLRPGANDVSGLSPGVYFARSGPSAATKVVVTR